MPEAARPDEIRQFFELLYGDCDLSAEASIALWSGRRHPTTWHTDVVSAANKAAEVTAERDCYFGVCLQNTEAVRVEAERRGRERGLSGPRLGRRVAHARGFQSTVSVVPGIWLDVDYGTAGHDQERLPPDRTTAGSLIRALPHQPSVTVHTGGGYHAYWLFREPFVIEDENERMRVVSLVRGWNKLARELAANGGYSLDSTWDLARVLRPVGTLNHKHDGCEVTLARVVGGATYNPSDFDDFALSVDDLARAGQAGAETAGVVVLPNDVRAALVADADPPADKLMAMMELHSSFAQTWRRQREFPSQSEYDMALASMAAGAGWPPGEIVALLVAHRRAHGQPLKLDRPDYYAMTICRVMQNAARQEAEQEIAAAVEGGALPADEDEDLSDESDTQRAGLLRQVSTVLGVEINQVIHEVNSLSRERDSWSIVLNGREIHLGNVRNLLDSHLFRGAVAEATHMTIPRMKNARWDPIATVLVAAAQIVDRGVDSEPGEVMREEVASYVVDNPIQDDRGFGILRKMPVLNADGIPAVEPSSMLVWMNARGQRWTRDRLTSELRHAGGLPSKLGAVYRNDTGEERYVRGNYWLCPWLLPGASEPETEPAEAS